MRTVVAILVLLAGVKVCAQSSRLLQRAEAYHETRQYYKAIEDYDGYFTKNNWDEHVLNWADCYLKTKQIENAAQVYAEYFTKFSYSDSLVVVYADLLKQSGKYPEAKEWYLKVFSSDSTKINFEVYAQRCDSSMKGLRSTSSWRVENESNVNSRFSEIAPVEYKSNLVFSSNREGTIIERKTPAANLPLYDLYVTDESSGSKVVKLFASELNTIHHECCATFTADYKKIFFTRTFDRPYSSGAGSKNSVKMFNAIWDGNKWDSLHTFIFNDTTRSYGHPSVEANEEMFFFASDMEGGYGGSDIYVCFNVDGKWTNPINLGPYVNSPYNELYPFYHADGTLYFSSNRPEGMGGYDIYSSHENDEGEYTLIFNPGFPLNSSSNDISMYWNAGKNIGYFSSDRPGGKGLEDIYRVIRKKK